MKIEVPSAWDKAWRIISFDIAEDKKASRDAVREHFLKLGFFELQDSVFVYPFDCFKEVEYISELYDVRKDIRRIVANFIDNEPELRKFFNLPALSPTR
jgi:CRISPR-associated endonuclease Cas2